MYEKVINKNPLKLKRFVYYHDEIFKELKHSKYLIEDINDYIQEFLEGNYKKESNKPSYNLIKYHFKRLNKSRN